MMWLKACPRCRGDLFMERNVGDSYMVCLQCGHVLNKAQEDAVRATMQYRGETAAASSIANAA
ncbi:MAG: hypothetical protein HY331_03585 [Chloroflexi bacterium]|nr:hypothetical protein [Chloroflexota bacterium]